MIQIRRFGPRSYRLPGLNFALLREASVLFFCHRWESDQVRQRPEAQLPIRKTGNGVAAFPIQSSGLRTAKPGRLRTWV
jgi:hypothetical protein